MKQKIHLLLLLFVMVIPMTLQSCDNDKDDKLPLPSSVETYIRRTYPNASIHDKDILPDGSIEVDIWDGNIEKELIFTSNGEWVSTSYDVPLNTLPSTITGAIKNSAKYGTYILDDADYIETPAGNYYWIELEKAGVPDIKVKIDTQGNFLP